ncbi:MAG: hypothetical protein U0U69_12070 [Acidimicrobiia bacterium]
MQQPRTRRLVMVGVGFVALTIAAGAVLLPPILGLVGIHVSATGGAVVAALAWVPSVVFVAGRSIAAARQAGTQRARLSSSAVVRDSL